MNHQSCLPADLARKLSIGKIFARPETLPVLAALVLSAWPLSAQIPAFPGAQGFGKFTSGGRGGSVYHVTTTNDSGTGSFRDAVSASGRTVVFDIGGIIDYSGSRFAPADNITIAGQTAPGDGITIYGDGLSFSSANNNICRFLRVREGINGTSGTDALGIANGHDMIFDHVSVSWGRDETFSINGNVTNITIQSTMVSQGLQGHSAGGLIQTDGGVSILRCLYMDNDTRNPKVKGVNEFVNNVVCNWETIGYNMGGDSAGDSYVNMFNNYFIRGQASSSTAIGGGNLNFHIYATNNWLDANRNGILDGSEMSFASYGSMDLLAAPYPYPITSAYSPLTALKLAISDVGTSFRRDAVDKMMISQLTSWGLDGGTITSELIPPMSGPGVIRNGAAYTDTDGDGMPDFWENGTGSSATTPNNNDASLSGSGYTRLEDYLNWLAEPHGIALQNTNVVVDLRQFTWGWVAVNHSPVWSVSNATNGAVALVNSYFARFIPTAGLNSNASFAFTVTDSEGSTLTRTMNLFFTPLAHSYSPIWHGDDLTNNWNVLGDFNWHDGISLLYQFHNGDTVTFDDSGSTSPAVNLSGSLQPASVTVAATKSFVFSGSGSLDGAMTLNKTNTGTLTIYTTNHFTGNTVVGNGALLVHGALNQSPVTVRSGGTVGGNGALGNGLTLQAGAALAPGNGIGAPGTLTVSNTLTLAGGVTNRFDFSDDPTGLIKTNDTVQIVGNLAVSGANLIKVSLLDGLPGNGVYTLFTYTGTFTGGLSNFTVSGASGALTNPPHAIAIVVNAVRPAATLVWKGDSAANLWDTGTNVNWLNDGVADRFYFLDDVVFDSSGSTSPAVNLAGDLTPNSVTVDATVNYTFGGTGKITGTTGLTKTNSGALAITTANDFTGPVIIGGGVLSVTRLANGGAASGIGAAGLDSANLQFYGSTLSYAGSTTATDRGATLNAAGATIEVTNSSATLTWNGTNVGTGALIKSGPGTLTLTAENSFSGGTIVSNGMLALSGPAGGATITANNYALGSGGVTLYGGILRLFGGKAGDASAGYGTFSRPINVPAGATASLYAPARYTMSSTLTGGGTLNFDVNYVRGTLSGNWSAFAGVINVTANTSPAEFRVANTYGYAGATIYLNDNVILTRSGSAATIEIGALAGSSGAIVGPGNSTSSGSSYRVGWNNADATFAGQLQADGANTFTKVGTGTWTLTGANSYTGGTVVNGGTLMANNTSGSGTGTGSVNVNTGATLTGSGIISGAVTISAGATIAPGTSIGTLTVNNSVTLAAGSTTLIEINKTSLTEDLLDSSATLTYGGTLIVTNLSGTLAAGDSFKIFDAATYSGSFASNSLPPLSGNLQWNLATLSSSGTLSVIDTNAYPQLLLWRGDGNANAWDTTNSSWLGTNGLLRPFSNADWVLFDDSGSNSPAINLTSTLAPVSVTVGAAKNYTFSGAGALAGTTSLIKSNTGTLTINNTGPNTFSGGTIISDGAVTLGAANALGTGNVTMSGGTLNLGTFSLVANNNLLISGSPTITGGNGGGLTDIYAVTGSGTLNLAPNNVFDLSGDLTGFSGRILFSGNSSVRLNGSLGSANAEFDLGNGTLNLNKRSTAAATVALGGLSGGAGTTLQGASGTGNASTTTFSIGGKNGSSAFFGTIVNGGGTSSLTKVGSGTLTLAGTNAYSGATTVSAGTLLLTGSNGPTTVTVASGGTFGGTGIQGGAVSVASGGKLSPGTVGAGTLTLATNLTLATAQLYFDLSSTPGGANDRINLSGTLAMSGAITYNFYLTEGFITPGVYNLIEGATGSTASSVTFPHNMVSTRQTFAVSRPSAGSNPSWNRLTVSGNAASLVWRGTNGSNWDVNTTNWLNGAAADRFCNLDSVTFNDTASTGTATLVGTLQPGPVVVVTNATLNYTFTGAGALTGPMQLSKSGAGSLTLDTTNTFTGGLLANAGNVALNNNAAAGTGALTLNGGTVTLAGAALSTYANALNFTTSSTLVSAGGANNTVSGNWSGSAGVTANVSIPIGLFTVTGGLTNFLGTVALGSSAGSFRISVPTGSTYAISNATFDLGTATGTLMNRNGATIILGGLAGGSATTLSGANSVDAPSTYLVGANNASTTFSGAIQNASALRTTEFIKIGTGTLTLAGNNTHSGGTTVSAGTLRVNNTLGTGGVVVKSGATLAGSGRLGGATTINSGATLAPGNSLGTLTFSNSLTLASGSTNLFEISTGPVTNDAAIVLGALTNGGTLIVTNLGATALASGDRFKLFNAGSYSGTFASVILPPLPVGLTWNTNELNTKGTLSVSPVTRPVIGSISVLGSNLTFSGTGGVGGASFYLLGSSDLTIPIPNWTRLLTNQFDASGNFKFTNALDASAAQGFYLLQVP